MNIFNNIIKYIIVVLMGLMTALTFYQIVLRYVFNSPSSWSEEAVRFIFIYVSFLAAGIGIMERMHVGIDVFVNMFSERIKKPISIIVNILIVFFGSMIIYISIPLLKITKRQLSPALRIPMHYIYAAASVFGILCIIYALYEIFRIVRSSSRGVAQTADGGGNMPC